ncbi:membrane dipeptidase [Isosphaeraceae bacterium EP7]
MQSSHTRRDFLTAAVGANVALVLAPAWLRAQTDAEDPRVERVLVDTIGIDIHNHVNVNAPGARPQQGPKDQQKPQPALDLADEIKRSGLSAVCAAFRLDFNASDPYATFLQGLDAIDGQLAKDRITRALNLNDLKTAHEKGQPTIVQSIEGAHFLEGHLDRVEAVYKRGLRHLQLLHDKGDKVTPLGDIYTEPARLGGLTAFGAAVVKECNRLGIVVDLAHASHETVLGALKSSNQPVIVSHTSIDTRPGKNPRMAKMMASRLISKDHARVVADAGGVIGVWTKLSDSMDEYVTGIKAMVDAVGIDHVGIGTDTDILSSRPGQSTNAAWPGLSGGFFKAAVAEMLRQGFTPDEIGKIGGGNFCRVFDKVTTGHA